MKKYLKYILISFILLFATAQVVIFIVRMPSYTIKTTGKLYIVSKVDQEVQVVDLSTGKNIAAISIDMLSHELVKTSNQKRIILTNYDSKLGNLVKVIDAKNNTVEKTIHLQDHRINGIAALPNANKVAVIDYVSNSLLVLNIENEKIEKEISTQQFKSHLIVLHPYKSLAFVSNVNSASVSVIDLNSNKVVQLISCGLGRKGLAVTPDGSELWITNINNSKVTVVTTDTYDILKTISTGKEPLKLNFSNDGKYCLIVNALDGTVSVFDQKSKKLIKNIVFHGKTTPLERLLYHTPRPVNVIFHPNGLYAFVSNSNANKIEIIDLKTFNIVSTIGTGKVPDGLVFVQ